MAEPVPGGMETVEPQEPTEQPAEPAQPEPPKQEAQAPVDPDQALDTETDESALDLQDGSEKLVPLGSVVRYRDRIKELKKELATVKPSADQAAQLQEQIQQMQAQLQALGPRAQAYDALLQAQQQHPQAQAQKPDPASEIPDSEALAVAQDLDLYTRDGKPDIERGRKIALRQIQAARQAAQQAAQEAVKPLQQQTISQQAEALKARYVNTQIDGKPMIDPGVLETVWNRAASSDPQTVATPEGAFWTAAAALGAQVMRERMQAAQQAQKAAPRHTTPVEAPPEPIFTERSGGRGDAAVQITEADRRWLKDAGITEKEYKESLAQMPEGWGKGA